MVLTNTSTNRATCDRISFQNTKSLVSTILSQIRIRVSLSINADRKENDEMKIDRAASLDCLASSVIYYMIFSMWQHFHDLLTKDYVVEFTRNNRAWNVLACSRVNPVVCVQ